MMGTGDTSSEMQAIRRMDGWMGGLDGWMDGWMDG